MVAGDHGIRGGWCREHAERDQRGDAARATTR
jgi:hypothetical protein